MTLLQRLLHALLRRRTQAGEETRTVLPASAPSPVGTEAARTNKTGGSVGTDELAARARLQAALNEPLTTPQRTHP